MTKASSKRSINLLPHVASFFILLLLLQACASPTRRDATQTTASTVVNLTPTDDGVIQQAQPIADTPTNVPSGTIALATYTVQPGDTLFGIASAYGLRPETVLWSNYGVLRDNPDLLSVGMELVIPPSDGLITIAEEGDSIDALARRFQVKAEDIVNEPTNRLTSTDQVLTPGQQLFIPGGQRETGIWLLPKPSERQTPVLAAPPAVAGWTADYRPNWIGYLDASGTLILVTPDGLGGTTAQTKLGWHVNIQDKPGAPIIVTQADKTGHISTWVFNPSTQNEFNEMLAQWQQTLQAEYMAGPCVVGIKGHDANITFIGPQAQAWCAALETNSSYKYVRLSTEPNSMHIVCEVAIDGGQVRVRDTGGQVIAADICEQLKAFGGDPPPANWDITKSVLLANDTLADALTSLENNVEELKQDTSFETVLDKYAELLAQMQVDYQKEQDVGSKSLPYCQNQIDAQNASYQVENGLYSVKNNDYALDNLGATLQNDLDNVTTNIAAVQTKLKELQAAVFANKMGYPLPRYTEDDIDTSLATAQAQVDSSSKALNDARVKAASFDKQAADLAQSARQLAASIKCP
jgi:LysM repeat protein